jgi:hypothetical protein
MADVPKQKKYAYLLTHQDDGFWSLHSTADSAVEALQPLLDIRGYIIVKMEIDPEPRLPRNSKEDDVH